MILNISGRTDIVAFYTPWLLNRFKEGFVYVRNPFYKRLVNRIDFKDVEAIVFCTKNPIPILPYLSEIRIPIIFQITLTPYHRDIEPHVPDKKTIIEAIKSVSSVVNKRFTYLRYDPILLNHTYTIDYHIKAFDKLCCELDGHIEHIILSFVDDYKNVRYHKNELNLTPINESMMHTLASAFSKIATLHHMTLQTCAEAVDLSRHGFIREDCVNPSIMFELLGHSRFKKWKARPKSHCHCLEMVDIGHYNSCLHLCKYCYANYNEKDIIINHKRHNPKSPLLVGELNELDLIKVRQR